MANLDGHKLSVLIQPIAINEIMNAQILTEQSLSYQKNGFTLFPSSIPKKLIANALLGTHRVLKGDYNTGVAPWSTPGVGQTDKIQRVQQIHLADSTVFKLLTHKSIGRLVANIAAAKRVQIAMSQLYFKPANSGPGGQVGFHRDTDYIAVFTKGAINAWLPLTDIDIKMGPLTYVNNSHCWPLKSRFTDVSHQNIDQQRDFLKAEAMPENWHETTSVTKAGGISFHHPKTLHGSAENITGKGRFAISMCLITDQVQFSGDVIAARKMLEDEQTYPVIYQA